MHLHGREGRGHSTVQGDTSHHVRIMLVHTSRALLVLSWSQTQFWIADVDVGEEVSEFGDEETHPPDRWSTPNEFNHLLPKLAGFWG